MKTKFALLCALFAVLASLLYAQSTQNLSIKVTVVDSALNLKDVPKFALVIRRKGDGNETRVSTNSDGQAFASLPAGDYVLASERPLTFESLPWSVAMPSVV